MKAKSFTYDQDREICRLYIQEHMGTINIGLIFNVSRTVIKRILKSHQIPIRNMSDCHKGQLAWNKGKKWSDEVRKKISQKAQDRFGKKNPNWKGGITPKYDNRRNLRIVKEWREKCLIRDSRTCLWCGSKEKIEVNHIVPIRQITDMELLGDINNGIALCRPCHEKIHYHEHEYTAFFNKLLKSRELRENPSKKMDNPDPSIVGI